MLLSRIANTRSTIQSKPHHIRPARRSITVGSDTIKLGVEKAGKMVKEFVQGNAPGHPKPGEFAEPTQEGKVVGIEAEMKLKPNFTEHEGENGFEIYKAANKLQNKRALITGGDSGIGRAVAVVYAMEGADVSIVYLPEEEVDAQETKKWVEKYGRKCVCIPADIRSEDACKAAVQKTVDELGGIDILVNNASCMYSKASILDIPTEQFDRTMKTNIYGTFFMTKATIPHLKRGASIIQTTSQVAYQGGPAMIDYAMTKAAILGLTRSLSQELLGQGIRVNAVAPGPVWTPMQAAAMDSVKLKVWEKTAAFAPIGRVGQPIELAPAYVLLASQDGSYIAGQTIHVNGGAAVNG
eukprot:TRINITY_DN7376_c0_g1_i1.p1 TRINITY_DN7376_c0_g1~~TRINITY_DN7376_c0_g1_i1.p1  ORF type:complete len:353 (+),score=87.97 TRINITY_DN7376_c0_g1_i1:90-1148(+)